MKFMPLGLFFIATSVSAETIVLGQFGRVDYPRHWNDTETRYEVDSSTEQTSIVLKLQRTYESCTSGSWSSDDVIYTPSECYTVVDSSRSVRFSPPQLVHENKKFVFKKAEGDVVCAELRKVGLLRRTKLVHTGKCQIERKEIDAVGTYEVTLTVK